MIELQDVCLRQGEFQLKNVNLCIPGGSYAVMMGRSGSGKTTIMELICGLRRVESGTVRLGTRDVTRLRPGERNIGYVPQDGALFPTMTVRQQVGFALQIRRHPKPEITARVDNLSQLLGITHLLDRLPAGLSGGERQRVAIGRALAAQPAILCLDEPLSALDDATRADLIGLLRDLRREVPVTTLHITHHRSEADELADELYVIDHGQVKRSELQQNAE